jgi:hypothetical protein
VQPCTTHPSDPWALSQKQALCPDGAFCGPRPAQPAAYSAPDSLRPVQARAQDDCILPKPIPGTLPADCLARASRPFRSMKPLASPTRATRGRTSPISSARLGRLWVAVPGPMGRVTASPYPSLFSSSRRGSMSGWMENFTGGPSPSSDWSCPRARRARPKSTPTTPGLRRSRRTACSGLRSRV